MSKTNGKKCPPGEILREGYHRKAYQRKAYRRSSGAFIAPVSVAETYVPPTCIIDRGKPGKGPKILPKPRNDMHLTKYGYRVHEPTAARHEALEKASEDNDPLTVLRRLNLIRNFQYVPENKETMSQDVDFMKDLYANYKKTHPNAGRRGPRSNSRRSRSRSKSQYGGDPMTSVTSATSDDHISETNISFTKEEHCENGTCHTINRVNEQHMVDGKNVVFATLEKSDAEQVLKLDQQHADSNKTLQQVQDNLSKNYGRIIGIKIDGTLEGYCQYQEINRSEVKLDWFCANKGYGSVLYNFMEKYFIRNNYHKIVMVVNLEGSYSVRRLNFWYEQGFKTYQTKLDDKKIHMEKDI